MPAKGQPDDRTIGIKRIESNVRTIIEVSRQPFTLVQIRTLAPLLSMNPKDTEWAITTAEWYHGRHDLQNPKFQQALRNRWRLTWKSMRDTPGTPERSFLGVDSYFNPDYHSYLIYADYPFVKDFCLAGATGVYTGPKGSGKTDICTSDMAKLVRLKQDHIDHGGKSLLSTYVRSGSRFWNSLYAPPPAETTPVDVTEVEPGPEPADDGGIWKPLKKLDLLHARDVCFPTNISIAPHSILGDSPITKKSRVQFGGRVSDMAVAAMENDQEHIMSATRLDEFGLAANKRRGMTTASWVIEQFTQTNRKSFGSLGVIAQDAVRQLSASLVENAQTRVEKPSLTHLDQAIITVSDMFQSMLFRDVPRSPVSFDTQSNASFFPDITLTVVWDYVTAKQRETIAAGGEWDHLSDLKFAKDFITMNRASEKDLAEGKSGILRSEVRIYLGKIDPTTGKAYTPERVARILAEDLEQDWKKEVLPIVLQVQADVKMEAELFKKLNRPPTSDEIRAAYEREKKVTTEHIPVTEENDDTVEAREGEADEDEEAA